MSMYRLPAEWEPQSGVQLTWPHVGTDWAPMLDEVTETYRQIASEIERREPLLIVAPEGTNVGRPFFACPTDDTWARDHGFITLVNNNSSLLLDFQFNGWGRKFPAEQDNAINRHLYEVGLLQGKYVDYLDFVLEGGSIESDGQGTIFTTTGCLMAKNRNQPLTKNEIEERLKRYLYADRILWIDYGQLTGDDTDGHIDTLVRICPDDTLVYVGCDDPADEQYEELRLMEEQLRTFRTKDNRPYRLLRLPLPRPIYDDEQQPEQQEQCELTRTLPSHEKLRVGASAGMGDRMSGIGQRQSQRLPATYANFLVVNGAVLCPTYDQPDLDSEALSIIGEAFPGRDIVGIDCRPLIRQHGSLHCCTMQFPADVLR